MTRRLGLGLATLLLLVGCRDAGPDTGDATEAEGRRGLSAVTEGLDRIDSGRISLSMKTLEPDNPPRGFEMEGIFAPAASDEEVPVAELTYRVLLPTTTRESRFVSDGSRAWVVTDRGVTELQGEAFDALKGGEDAAGVRQLALDDWFDGDPSEQPGEVLDGTETVTYSGAVDAGNALNNLIAMTGDLGANVPAPLNDEGLGLVRDAARSPQAVVAAGADDDLIRRVTFSVEFPSDRDDLGEALGRLYADRLEFELSLTAVNQPVERPSPPEGPAAPTTTTQPPPDFPEPPTIPS